MRRIHRTFKQRVVDMALFECPKCHASKEVGRPFTYYLGQKARGPLCGTLRVRKIAKRDPVDPMYRNFVYYLRTLMQTKLYHCMFSRRQFLDWRDAHSFRQHGTQSPAETSKSGEGL